MAYTQELDDIAEWFLNCGMESLTTEQIASIIRKWRPSVEAAQQSEQAEEPFTWQCQGCGAVLWSNQNEHCPNCG